MVAVSGNSTVLSFKRKLYKKNKKSYSNLSQQPSFYSEQQIKVKTLEMLNLKIYHQIFKKPWTRTDRKFNIVREQSKSTGR